MRAGEGEIWLRPSPRRNLKVPSYAQPRFPFVFEKDMMLLGVPCQTSDGETFPFHAFEPHLHQRKRNFYRTDQTGWKDPKEESRSAWVGGCKDIGSRAFMALARFRSLLCPFSCPPGLNLSLQAPARRTLFCRGAVQRVRLPCHKRWRAPKNLGCA